MKIWHQMRHMDSIPEGTRVFVISTNGTKFEGITDKFSVRSMNGRYMVTFNNIAYWCYISDITAPTEDDLCEF